MEADVEFDSATNTYTFYVPYYVYDRGKLNDWKLFYTKSVGATATVNGDTMPKSGATVGGNTYIPNPATSDDIAVDGTGIDLRVTGEDLSLNTATYYIKVVRKAASEASELTSLNLVGTLDYTEVTERNTYKGVPSNTEDNTYDVEINLSLIHI